MQKEQLTDSDRTEGKLSTRTLTSQSKITVYEGGLDVQFEINVYLVAPHERRRANIGKDQSTKLFLRNVNG